MARSATLLFAVSVAMLVAGCGDRRQRAVKVRVPNLTGLSMQAAARHLGDRGLCVGTVNWTERASRVASNHVVRQEPQPGTSVMTGRTVAVVLATHASSASARFRLNEACAKGRPTTSTTWQIGTSPFSGS
jgi:beta-lactam-binding protein with PASTA domain